MQILGFKIRPTVSLDFIFCLFISLFIYGCNPPLPLEQATPIISDTIIVASQLTIRQQIVLDSIQGKWLVADYMDGIYKNKSIQKSCAQTQLTHKALFIEIQDSLINLCGTIECYDRNQKHSFNKDSLVQIRTYKGQLFILYYEHIDFA